MKTSLDHLPPRKQRQLAALVDEIRAAVADVELVILFGSHARGNWVEDPVGGYFSDYDVLVVVKSPKTVEKHDAWSRVENRMERQLGRTVLTLIVHDVADVNRQLELGQYFFSDIKKEGVVLYDAGRVTLAEAKEKTPEERRGYARQNYEQWFTSADEFLGAYELMVPKGWLKLAAFHLHQATERYYTAALLVLSEYKPKDHNIAYLGKLAGRLAPELRGVFPTAESEGQADLRAAQEGVHRRALLDEVRRDGGRAGRDGGAGAGSAGAGGAGVQGADRGGGVSGGNGKQEPVVGYLQRVEIENIRSILSLHWEVTPGPGWNVLLGDNGSGKTTFLRAVAYATIPRQERSALRRGMLFWMRDKEDDTAHFSVQLTLDGHESPPFQVWFNPAGGGWLTGEPDTPETLKRVFVAGFGPFRRFTGGDLEYEKQFAELPCVGRIISLFDERFSLAESLAWLKLLRFREATSDPRAAESKMLLEALRALVNQGGLLPNGVQLDRITADYVIFKDGYGLEIPVDELSDGYRSILSLTFELIRQLAAHYGAAHVFNASSTAVIAPGIVLIDEIDAHLHPSWQRQIGFTLRKLFPNIQWVVATHSPLICQAAIAETDTIYHLPRPGTDEEPHRVTGSDLYRLVYGDMTEAFGTQAMGDVERSEKAKALLHKLGLLNRKQVDVGLSEEEQEERRQLRRIFGAGPFPEKQA